MTNKRGHRAWPSAADAELERKAKYLYDSDGRKLTWWGYEIQRDWHLDRPSIRWLYRELVLREAAIDRHVVCRAGADPIMGNGG